jgi:[citrate (pro-3S)-lyase] ligase
VRDRLVREGTCDLSNVVCHGSGDYIISQATFPGYFLKSKGEAARTQAEMDIKVFQLIAKELGITVRYAGDEPFSETTEIYNSVMERLLPEAGIEFRVIPRLRISGEPVSASRVRQLISDGDIEKAEELLPPASIEYFRSSVSSGQT